MILLYFWIVRFYDLSSSVESKYWYNLTIENPVFENPE